MKTRKAAVIFESLCLFALASCGETSVTSSASVANTTSKANTSGAQTTTIAPVTTSAAKTFDTTKAIKAYTRDTTSGTRDGFFTKIGLGAAKTDNAPLVKGYVEVASNGAMATAVANDEYGIGYISLSTLDSSGLVGLSYAGVKPSEANVLNNTYQLTRNFNYITRADYSSTAVRDIAAAFVAYMSTVEGKAIMKAAEGIVTITGTEPTWASIKSAYPIAAKDNSAVTVRFGGSTSVEKMAKKLTAAFSPLCGNFIPSHNHTGSGDAYKHTQGSGKDDSGALDVGFLSRELELTSAEPAVSGTYGKMCTDAIVAVVNQANTYTATDAASLKGIYDGTYTKWSDLIK
jgi:phosphate transport system substrate-binding protein